MNMNLKKWICIPLSLVLICSAAACSTSGTEATTPAANTSDAQTTEAPDANAADGSANTSDDPLSVQVNSVLHAPIMVEQESPEWVANLPTAKDESVKQMVVVAGMGMTLTTASVTMHERAEDGTWKQIMSTPGYVGLNGLVPELERVSGTSMTPTGVYHFTQAFGIAPDPGCKMPYVQVDDDTYWSGDINCEYNRMVNTKDHPEYDTSTGEHIRDYEYQYQYCLNISFNEDGWMGLGHGNCIFLHCIGNLKPYTGGCVAVPEYAMKFIIQHVEPDCQIVIDTLENMGGSL